MARRVRAGVSGGTLVSGLQTITTTITSATDLDITVDPIGTGRFLIDAPSQIQNRNPMRFATTSSSNWVALRGPATAASNITWTLPNTDGTSDQVLTTNGSGDLSWTTKSISIQNNTTDSDTHFVTLTTATTDTTVTTLRRSSSKLTFQPSTGTLTVTELRATGDVTAFFSSDAALKENIKNIPDALNKLASLNGVSYDWTNEYIERRGGEDGYFVRKKDIGLIAQEVERVLPEIVAQNSDGYKSIKYERVVALCIEAIKELKKEIEQLRKN